jgi:hypothetical protein
MKENINLKPKENKPSRRNVTVGLLSLILPFENLFSKEVNAQGKVKNKKSQKENVPTNPVVEKLRYEVENLRSAYGIEISTEVQGGIDMALEDSADVIKYTSLKSPEAFLCGVLQLKEQLKKYPSIRVGNFVKRFFLFQDMAFSNDRRSPHGVFGIYNKEPIIALKLHNETILKDMYDKGVELKYENVFDTKRSAFDHEMGHAIAKDIGKEDWVNGTYGLLGLKEPEYMEDLAVQEKRPKGFFGSYAKFNFYEDIASYTGVYVRSYKGRGLRENGKR